MANSSPILTGIISFLTDALEDTDYLINTSDLVAGYTDVDNDILSVDSLASDQGSFTNNNDGTWTFKPKANYFGTVNFTYNVIDGNGGSVSASQSFNLLSVNDEPTFNAFNINNAHGDQSIATVEEDTTVVITLDSLLSQSDAKDIDGSITAFNIKEITSGTLLIGETLETATTWVAGSNFTIDATLHAYWLADTNANNNTNDNLPFNAFTVVAVDNQGLESITPVQATISVTPVNDAPVGTVTIDGIPAQGETLTVDTSKLSDPDMSNGITGFEYQWYANNEAITGATNNSYILSANQIGKAITAKVSYTDLFGTTENVFSSPIFAGNYLTLNQENQYLLGVDDNLPLGNTSRTLDVWLRTTTPMLPNDWIGSVVQWGGSVADIYGINFNLEIDKNGTVWFDGRGAALLSDKTVNDGLWHKITLTYDGNVGSIYIDGQLDITSDASHGVFHYYPFNQLNTNTTYNDKLIIGNSVLGHQFQGDIRAVDVYNRSLSAQEIANQLLPTGNETGLVSYYDLSKININGFVTDQTNIDTSLTATGLNLTQFNQAPTFTSLTSPIVTGSEDSQVTITFNDLLTKSDASDVDGSIKAFIVKAPMGGTLFIGTNASTATPFNPTNNFTIDATHQAFWKAWTTAYGTIDSFTVVAQDDTGLISANTPVKVKVDLTPINHTPFLNLSDGTIITDISLYDQSRKVIEQADGKIVVGSWTSANLGYIEGYSLIRYNQDGSIDNSFNGTGIVNNQVGQNFDLSDVVQQNDGKLIVIGTYNDGQTSLIRYNNNGSLDTSFSIDGLNYIQIGSRSYGFSGAIQSDGKILVGGTAIDTSLGKYVSSLARFNADGTLDNTFSNDGSVMCDAFGSVTAIAMQSDGKILISGDGFGLVRYNIDGSIDTSFGNLGIVATHNNNIYESKITIQSDGSIIIYGNTIVPVGSAVLSAVLFESYNSDGSRNLNFGNQGSLTVIGDKGNIEQDGSILVTKHNIYDSTEFIHYTNEGIFVNNTSIAPPANLGSYGAIIDSNIQSDGKILVTGFSQFDYNNRSSDIVVSRYNNDGSLDTSFGAKTTPVNYVISSPPVLLSSDVQLFDIEHSNGICLGQTTLSLARHNGANRDDKFVSSNNSFSLTEGTWTPVGFITKNSDGILQINLGRTGQSDLDNFIHSIGYINQSNTPPASVQIDWIFNDGGYDGLGSGALTASISTFVNIIPNTAPSFSAFKGEIKTSSENLITPIDFNNLNTHSNASDIDGTIDAFDIKAITSGTLVIGTDLASATPWDASTNSRVDASHLAFWTPNLNTSGTSINAFTAVAVDNGGLESEVPVQATVNITHQSPLEFKTISTPIGIDLQVWLKAGQIIDSTDLVINYDASKATLFDTATNADLTDWNWVVNNTPIGSALSSGMSLTPINSGTDTLLEILHFAPTAGSTDFFARIINGTDLFYNNQLISLDSLQSIDSLTETDAIILATGTLSSSYTASTLIGLYGNLSIDTSGLWSYATSNAHNEFSTNSIYNDNFYLTDSSGVTTNLTFAINGTNDAPTLNSFASTIATGAEDTQISINFDSLKAQSDATDIDGNVTAFAIKALTSGTLLIGTNANSATAWNAIDNFTVDASHLAFWTPNANTNGTLNTFTVIAIDNGGLESVTAIQTTVAVTPVNDAPTLNTFTGPIGSGNEDSQITINFANLIAQSDATDIDGTIDSFVIKTVNSGTLLIGGSADTATLWDATSNNIVDATHQAFWVPDLNAYGSLNAFSAVAKDNGGLESLTAIQARVAVSPTPTHNLSEIVTFWKTDMALSNVSSTVISEPSNPSTQIEFKNTHVNADGSRTLEVWENSAGVNSVDLHLSLPSEAGISWSDDANLPQGWTSIANTQTAGHFDLAGIGLNALKAGSVKLGTLSLSNPTQLNSLNVQLSTALLGEQRVSPFEISTDSINTLVNGVYTHTAINEGTHTVSTDKSPLTIGDAIRANDALSALKIAVGINPNANGSNVSGYQYLAADINHDGRVNAADALNILKMAVNSNAAPEKTWLFVPDTVGTETMSRTNVNWADTINPVTVNQDQTIHLVGVVAGDIDGSWVG